MEVNFESSQSVRAIGALTASNMGSCLLFFYAGEFLVGLMLFIFAAYGFYSLGKQ